MPISAPDRELLAGHVLEQYVGVTPARAELVPDLKDGRAAVAAADLEHGGEHPIEGRLVEVEVAGHPDGHAGALQLAPGLMRLSPGEPRRLLKLTVRARSLPVALEDCGEP